MAGSRTLVLCSKGMEEDVTLRDAASRDAHPTVGSGQPPNQSSKTSLLHCPERVRLLWVFLEFQNLFCTVRGYGGTVGRFTSDPQQPPEKIKTLIL